MSEARREPEIILTANDPHYAEQYPLAPIDDYMIHQTPDPIRVMWTSDARAYERYWVTCQDQEGELFIVQGGGFYPSLDTAEAYCIVNYQGQHTTVRAFRRLGADRMNLHIGPIKPTIIQGLRVWHYVLEENEYGISYDFYWYDTKRQVFRGPADGFAAGAGYPGGRQRDVTVGFEGFGYPEGWVKIGNKRIELTKEKFRGSRDRHWGVRFGVGGPAHQLNIPRRGGGGGQWVEFKEWSVWGNRILYNYGDPRPGAGRIVKIERFLKFEPDTHIFQEGVIRNTLEDGTVRELHYKRLNFQTAYLRCGMYGGPNGGTPDKNIWHGMYVGDNVVEGETYDVTKPEVRARICGLDDHHCIVTCDGETTWGIFEPYEPAAYENCRDGVPGWNFLE